VSVGSSFSQVDHVINGISTAQVDIRTLCRLRWTRSNHFKGKRFSQVHISESSQTQTKSRDFVNIEEERHRGVDHCIVIKTIHCVAVMSETLGHVAIIHSTKHHILSFFSKLSHRMMLSMDGSSIRERRGCSITTSFGQTPVNSFRYVQISKNATWKTESGVEVRRRNRELRNCCCRIRFTSWSPFWSRSFEQIKAFERLKHTSFNSWLSSWERSWWRGGSNRRRSSTFKTNCIFKAVTLVHRQIGWIAFKPKYKSRSSSKVEGRFCDHGFITNHVELTTHSSAIWREIKQGSFAITTICSVFNRNGIW